MKGERQILVSGMVFIGGMTRLTNSGLSMDTWKPVTGIIPPLGDEERENEINSYKKYPEYKLINRDMTHPEFKRIIFWDYQDRLIAMLLLLSVTNLVCVLKGSLK